MVWMLNVGKNNFYICVSIYVKCRNFLLFTRYDQKVLCLMYFRIPRNEKFGTFLQYNLPSSWCTFSISVPVCLSLQNRSLHPGPPSTHLFNKPSLPPKFLPRRLVFSFGNRQKSEGAKSKSGKFRGWGRTSKPHSVAAAMAACNVWAGALSCKSRVPPQLPQFFCIICTVYCATFVKIIIHDYSLIIQRIEAITFPAEETLFRRGWARVLPMPIQREARDT